MKTLIILTSNFPPTSIVGALRPFRMARSLAAHGWRSIVITGPPGAGLKDYSLLDDLPPQTEIRYTELLVPLRLDQATSADALAAHFGPTERAVSGSPIAARIRGAIQQRLRRVAVPDIEVFKIRRYVNALRPIAGTPGKTVLMSTSPPHSVHLAGLLSRRAMSLPWIVDLRDPWDNYPITGRAELKNPIERRLERAVITRADRVISTTDAYTRILRRRYRHEPQEKFRTITNSYDPERVFVSGSPDRERLVISYGGIFYPEKDPYTFFRALRSWLDTRAPEQTSRLSVRLIGSNDRDTRAVVAELGLGETVQFVDRCPHEDVVRLLRGSDLLLLATGLGAATRPGWIPSKLIEYLGCRRPILAVVPEGESARIVRETDSGYVVSREDHRAIHEILDRELAAKLRGCSSPGEFSFKGVERFDREKTLRELAQILEDLVGRGNGTETSVVQPNRSAASG